MDALSLSVQSLPCVLSLRLAVVAHLNPPIVVRVEVRHKLLTDGTETRCLLPIDGIALATAIVNGSAQTTHILPPSARAMRNAQPRSERC